jgi:phosphomannomutase / phosphoglucomutase
MDINPYIFRNYDIRGIVDVDLDDNKLEAIGKAFGTFLIKRKIYDMVCGRDCRLSGPSYQQAFMAGVQSTGVDIIDLGLIMTQMMYYGQYRFQTNGGAILTASHNPWNYNGFKLGIGYSQTTGPEEVKEILNYIQTDQYYQADTKGKITKADIREDYIKDTLKRVRNIKKFKVLVDSHNGTTGIYVPEMLRRAGLEVIESKTNIDGHFPNGTPDPTDAKVMENIAQQVLEHKADVGLTFDGDGDRIGLVDEKGNVLWNDVALAIFAKGILERFPKSKIIYNGLCSQVVDKVIRQEGGTPIMWRTGHSFIKQKIAEELAVFGGELSGHFFFADNAYGHDDGAYASLRILEYLSEQNLTLSQLYESFPQYISSPEIKIGCPDDKKVAVVKDLIKVFKKDFAGAQITDDTVIPGDDGVRADFDDGMIVFRYSQNGPYVTIKFEATTQEVFEERRAYIRKILHSYPDMIWADELCVNLDFVK